MKGKDLAESREGAPSGAGREGTARAGKAADVQKMFSTIAPRYDLLNHLLSANLDRRWRRSAVSALVSGASTGGLYVDACAGTLDLSRELATRPGIDATVVAADFAYPMLQRGAPKVGGMPVHVVCADATRLPLASRSVDGVIVGFGVRNLASLDDGLAELARVVRSGGRLVLLEFTVPTRQPVRSAYLFYFRRVLPRIGRLISGHGSAYDYLPASVLEFPAPAALAERMRGAGFADVRWQTMAGGIVALHVGYRS